MEANKIDWSKAPKSATHYAPSHGHFSEVWIRELTSKSYEFNTVSGHGLWTDSEDITKNELDGIVERPRASPINVKEFGAITESKPVFTQEMFDAGTLPSVGMECMVYVDVNEGINIREWFSAVVVGSYKELPIIRLNDYDDEEGYFDTFELKYIKPLDTRTDEEKAIDDIKKYSLMNINEINRLIRLVRGEKIHGLTWSKS